MEAEVRGIVFFDLDGTLLNNRENQIPESAMEALSQLRENDYRIVISTGRDMDGHYSLTWKEKISPDAIIHLNGTKITVGDRIIFEHFMAPELLSQIYDFAMETGICFGTTLGDRDFYTFPDKKRYADQFFSKAIKRNYRPFSELMEEGLRIHALSYAGNMQRELPLIEEHFPMLELLGFDSGRGADVVEKGNSKADGLLRVCEYYGVDVGDTAAFGDSLNDIRIVEKAGIGIAVGNAVEELKEAADYIAPPIWEDGIYRACEHFGMI